VHKYLSLTLVLFCISYVICYAQSISSTELISHAKQYDAKTVVYSGEVIGEIMVRGEYAWVNICDGENAIGIWVDKGLTKDIRYAGSYKSKGDWVEITGIFQRACGQHGGDLDIHALSIRKVNSGRSVSEKLNLNKRSLALVWLGILGLVWILRRFIKT
jgi:hypothetical protein